jgi:hypothetical protein
MTAACKRAREGRRALDRLDEGDSSLWQPAQ